MENNTAVVFPAFLLWLQPAEDSFNQMLCALPLRVCIEQNDPSGESECAFRCRPSAPVI